MGVRRVGTRSGTKRAAVVVLAEPPVLDVEEAARLLRVSPDTLLRLKLPCVRIGGGSARTHRRYLRTSIIRYLEAHEEPEEA